MDYAIQQLHRDIRWAQRAAEKADQLVTITFYRYKQPYTYSVRYAGSPEHLRRRELPNRIDKITAETIIINRDKRIQKNGHILLQINLSAASFIHRPNLHTPRNRTAKLAFHEKL